MLTVLSTVLAACLITSLHALPSSQERIVAAALRGSPGTRIFTPSASNIADAQYSVNWAGAILQAPSDTLREVTATLTLPNLTPPSGVDPDRTTYWGQAWIGIDGDQCDGGSARVGFYLYSFYDSDEQVNSLTIPFYQIGYAEDSHSINGLNVWPGDSVTLTISATSRTAGFMYVTDNARGTTVSVRYAAGAPLCRQEAVWVIEDPVHAGTLSHLPDYGALTFTNASAAIEDGQRTSRRGPQGAHVVNMFQERLLSDVGVGASTVSVVYVP
ncbi:peptidase G1 domain-containing protein [Phanerochaete sordida]|uniref:Peptidase G1 domain-containing protein n=1 Tax=Phanerochaete sordida TaxID=48140 RepID=A0A9P3GNS3_9APHY|nr:peptidase G1 domain-containing protein [Phanerochaete sordida]